jgi:hypothetical protein
MDNPLTSLQWKENYNRVMEDWNAVMREAI